MKAHIALGDIKMTLDQRQHRTFPRAGWATDAQHLPWFKPKIHIFQRRVGGLWVTKFANRHRQLAASFRHQFSTVIHYRRFCQHGANSAIRGAATLDDVKHPCQRQHRPNHQTEIHHKAGELAERQRTVHHHPASPGNRQQVSHPNGDINRGIKASVNARHAQVFLTCIFSISGK